MPPTEQQDNPFFFSADVDVDNLKNSLSKAEKMYLAMAAGMSKMVEGLEDLSKKEEEAGKKSKKQAGDEEKRSNKRSFFARARGKMSKGFLGILKREKGAADGLGISLKSLGGLIGGATIIGLIGKAVSSYLKFYTQIAQLNTTLSGTPRLMNVAAGAVQGLTGYLNLGRDELVQVAKSLNVVALEVDKLPGSRKIFRGIFMDTIHLAKSMDVSSQSVADLYTTFLRVYKLPHHSLRGIAASMKFIQEQTGISGEELLSFGKSLDKILAQMIGVSGKGKAKVTQDLMAMAGVLKKAGVDPKEILGVMQQATDITNEQGQKFLAFISEGTGKTAEDIRQMILKGKVLDVAGMLGERLKKVGKRTLVDYQRFYGEQTGVGIASMLRMRNISTKQLKAFAKAADEQAKKRALHTKRAQALQHSLLTAWNALKRAFEKLWLAIGKRLTEFIARVSGPVIKAITGWVNWITSPQGGQAIEDWFGRVVQGAKNVWKWIKAKVVPIFQWLGEKIAWVWKKWDGLSATTKKWLLIGGGLLLLFGKFVPLIAVMGSKVAIVVAGLTALYVGAKKVADWIDKEQTKRIKATSQAKVTSSSITQAMGAGKAGRMGFVKGEMFGKEAKAGKTLVTPGGKVNVKELQRRAMELIPTPMGWDLMPDALKRKFVLQPRAALVEQWRQGLNAVLGQTDMKAIRASRARDLALLKGGARGVAAKKPVAAKPATPVSAVKAKVGVAVPPTPAVEPPAPPVITVKADSKTRNMLLAEIREILKGMQQQNAIRRAHPATAAVKGALG